MHIQRSRQFFASNPQANKELANQPSQLIILVANLTAAVNSQQSTAAEANRLPVVAIAADFELIPGLAAGNNVINFIIDIEYSLLLYKAAMELLPTPFDVKVE